MSEVSESLGQRLKAERERRGLSTQKAADELHLDPWAVDALESGDYARIGPSVYIKGHLKRYAELLGLPAAALLEAYETPSSAPAPQPATLRMRTSAPAGSEFPWIQIAGFAVVAVVIVGVLWLRPWHPRPAAMPAATTALPDAAARTVPAADRGPSADGSNDGGATAPRPRS
jgi:cytoskeleton protein RodZ